MSVNKVILVGRLGADPELKYAPNGIAVASLKLATSEVKMKDGKREEKTEWHRVIVFGKQAENCKKYVGKGRQIYIEGRLQSRSWEKDGQKHSIVEVVANVVQFLGERKEEKEETLQTSFSSLSSLVSPPPKPQPIQQDFSVDDIPF